MSESSEVESNYDNPKGRSNLEKGAEPTAQKMDPTDSVQVANDKTKKPSNPKMPPSRNREYAGRATIPEVPRLLAEVTTALGGFDLKFLQLLL